VSSPEAVPLHRSFGAGPPRPVDHAGRPQYGPSG